jgi:lipoate-protein ligase A
MLVLLPNAFGDAVTNMAIDTALLQTIPPETALFRHYGWTEPTITFGYSQRFREIAATTPEGVVLCRRATGGGIVDHRNDWTYSLTLGPEPAATQSSSTALYEKVHVAIVGTLRFLEVPARLAPCPKKCAETPAKQAGPDQCFIQPVMNDVLTQAGRKIAGAAMKRGRTGFLIQGSIDRAALPESLDFQAFQRGFLAQLSETLQLRLDQPEDLRPFFDSERIKREKQKFSSAEWTQRR